MLMKRILGTIVAGSLLAIGVSSWTPAEAGREGGASETHEQVRAGYTDVYTIRFCCDERAVVRARGDGDIDMFVYDQYGNLICKDEDYDSIPVCSFTPRRAGPFTIRIKNCEQYPVDYVMTTN